MVIDFLLLKPFARAYTKLNIHLPPPPPPSITIIHRIRLIMGQVR